MRLNLPILEQIGNCRNILIAGMGGGFDVFCGLPIYFDLEQRGYSVHLASLTSSSLKRLKGANRLSPSLVGVRSTTESYTPYFPELHLTPWFQTQGQEVVVWCFEKSGVVPLVKNYRILIDHLAIDGVLLIDGGVDSLVRGDELEVGSPLEDAVSLSAVSQLHQLEVRLTACLGLGAEMEMNYADILQNIAGLTKAGGFKGSCSLTPEMDVYQLYEEALNFVYSQPRQDTSVINSSVVSAVQGNHGDYHLTEKTFGKELSISPLMAIYWFFELSKVAERSLIVPNLLETQTLEEAWQVMVSMRDQLTRRPSARMPLS